MIKVVMYKDGAERMKVGEFYVPGDADRDWLRRNVPELIHAGQLMAGDAEPWGEKGEK